MKTAFRYTVMPGDTLFSIAEGIRGCADVTCQAIEAANPGVNPNMLTVGQVLNIPAIGSVSEAASDPVQLAVTGQEKIGFWRWTWSPSVLPPAGCNLGLAFSGWTDIANALQQSSTVYDSVPNSKYITFGGGNENGAFDEASLGKITDAIRAGKFASYVGIAYDIEEGDPGLSAAFAGSFKAAQEKGLKVLVTISHSAPYGISDAHDLMQSFFADPNIDFLSPQLYTTGSETQNQYDTSGGVPWTLYAGAKAKVIPSIVRAGMYADAQAYFAQQGVTLAGFVQWSQE